MSHEPRGINGVLKNHANIQITKDPMKMEFKITNKDRQTIIMGDLSAFEYNNEGRRREFEQELEAHLELVSALAED